MNITWLHTSISPEWDLSSGKTVHLLWKCTFETMTLDLSYIQILDSSLLVSSSLFCQPLEQSWWLFLFQIKVPDCWLRSCFLSCLLPPFSAHLWNRGARLCLNPPTGWAFPDSDPHSPSLPVLSLLFFIPWCSGRASSNLHCWNLT